MSSQVKDPVIGSAAAEYRQKPEQPEKAPSAEKLSGDEDDLPAETPSSFPFTPFCEPRP